MSAGAAKACGERPLAYAEHTQSTATAGHQERGVPQAWCAAASDALAAGNQTQPEQCAAEQTPRPGTVSRAPDRVLEEP